MITDEAIPVNLRIVESHPFDVASLPPRMLRFCYICSTKKALNPYGSRLNLVEMVGVEPTSKSISEETSPSAADDLDFTETTDTSAV